MKSHCSQSSDQTVNTGLQNHPETFRDTPEVLCYKRNSHNPNTFNWAISFDKQLFYTWGLDESPPVREITPMLSSSPSIRVALLSLWLGCLFSLPAQAQPKIDPPDRPNVLVILADDLGYGDLGSYGQKKVKTPNLDRLALEGTRFTQFYAGSSLGNASRASLMTGKHTGHSNIRGVSSFASSLHSSDVTIAKVLQRDGYLTGAFGKWSMGDSGSAGTPNAQGFKEWLGFLNEAHSQMYYPPFLYRNESLLLVAENDNQKKVLYAPDLIGQSAATFIRIASPAPYAQKRRFFTYLASQFPHANIDLGYVSGNGMEIPSDAPYTDEKWPQPDKNRAAMISHLDMEVGKLMEQLTKSKVETNTVVIFTSATGAYRAGGANPDFFNASGGLRGQRGELYEGGLRVPLLVWWPGNVKSGNIVETPCAMWDLLPTIAHLTGSKIPDNIDGRSLVPALKGQALEPASYLYWEQHNEGFAQGLRLGDWKAIRVVGKPLELYNLKQDPKEKKDVAAQQPEEVKKVTALMREARTESDQWPTPDNFDK